MADPGGLADRLRLLEQGPAGTKASGLMVPGGG